MTNTDAYKISMAQAGFPLRKETFYFSFRRGGWQYIPFDLKEIVNDIISSVQVASKSSRLIATGTAYTLSTAMDKALLSPGKVTIDAVPKGSWVYEREPILSVTGPSFLVSVIEPLVLQLSYRIQLATVLKRKQASRFVATCSEQADVILHTAALLGQDVDVDIQTDEYRRSVKNAVVELLSIVDSKRVFEVGLRAATCVSEHAIAMEVLSQAGVSQTSATSYSGMSIVGTMGHEHVQRFGDDLEAYRAMRDRTCLTPSYLLDTHDTVSIGIPAAIMAAKESDRPYSIRYDSGRKLAQFAYAEGVFLDEGVIMPTHIIEDGLRPDLVRKFEKMRTLLDVPEERVLYGFGGYLISAHWDRNPFTRDQVSAVYKLSETNGRPTMKFGNEQGIGKQSVPGRPVVWRRMRGNGPQSVIAQLGETPADDYAVLTNDEDVASNANMYKSFDVSSESPYALSPMTAVLVEQAEEDCLL